MNVKKVIFSFSLVIFLSTFSFNAVEAQDKKAEKEAREKIEKALKPYTQCALPGVLWVADVDRVTKKKEETLSRETPTGVKEISRTDSYRVMIGFGDDYGSGSAFYFANVRPDRSKPEQYLSDKQVLIENLKHVIATTASMETKEPVEKTYYGFATYNVNRSALAGATLGQSLIFDDDNKIITTIYFLNAPVDLYKKYFKNFEEWKILRDKFLDSYTKCVGEELKK